MSHRNNQTQIWPGRRSGASIWESGDLLRPNYERWDH
jgi:hypothetical protein